MLRFSPEMDTLRWMRHMQPIAEKNGVPKISAEYMSRLPDGSGYVTCGNFNHSMNNERDFGYLFKVSPDGDSLWTRYYEPLNWEPFRARWMTLYQVIPTPYGGIVVCGRVADKQENAVKGWVMHLDVDGCLVPGCGLVNKTRDKNNEADKFLKYTQIL